MQPWALPPDLEVGADPVSGAPTVLRLADGQALDVDRRAHLVASARNGALPSRLHLDIVAFRQNSTRNRNFVRFSPSILKPLAESFVGAPFLRDHAQRNLLARGGTILASTHELGADGAEFRQTIELVTPWAIEAALQGLMDRFSIGWHTTGPVLCSVCESPMLEGDCGHLPGDPSEGGAVEAIITGADGVETSAVLVPAVVGTGVEAIRAALTASRLHKPAPHRRAAIPGANMTRFLAQVATSAGLPDDAPEDTILAAVEGLRADHERMTALLDVERRAHDAAKKRADELGAELASVRAAEDGRVLDALIDELRGKVGQKIGADGKAERGGTPSERVLISLAGRSLAEARAFVAELSPIIPVGLESRPISTAAAESARTARARLLDSQLDLTADDYARFSPRKVGP